MVLMKEAFVDPSTLETSASGKSSNSVEDVLREVVKAANDDHLLLFFGTGFSRAVLRYGFQTRKSKYCQPILGWVDLLEKITSKLKLDFDRFKHLPQMIDLDCPAIATGIAKKIGKNGSLKIKESAAQQTMWIPRRAQCKEIGDILRKLNPTAIVTTNYDEVIEGLLGDDCKSLASKDEVQVPMRVKIAVWHFHGSRNDPTNIVLTREDYLDFFRPGNYAQTKLSQLLHDNFTLFVGYSLSDINLLAALDWAQNVYRTTNGFLGYAQLDKLDSREQPQGCSKEKIRRLIVEFSKDCKDPVLGDSPSESCAVISTNDVISILRRISGERMQASHNREQTTAFQSGGIRQKGDCDGFCVKLPLKPGSAPEDILEEMAAKFHNDHGTQTDIIETHCEDCRRFLSKRPSSKETQAMSSIESIRILMGMLHVFHLSKMPVSWRIDFLEELESQLKRLSPKKRRHLVSEESALCAKSDTMRENMDWLLQVSSYCNCKRCAKFAESILGEEASY